MVLLNETWNQIKHVVKWDKTLKIVNKKGDKCNQMEHVIKQDMQL